VKTIKLLSISVYDILRWQFLECRISSIEDRIDKLQDLSLFFQSRFDQDRSAMINNKIEYLSKKKADLVANRA
jgi:hypothetical protein